MRDAVPRKTTSKSAKKAYRWEYHQKALFSKSFEEVFRGVEDLRKAPISKSFEGGHGGVEHPLASPSQKVQRGPTTTFVANGFQKFEK